MSGISRTGSGRQRLSGACTGQSKGCPKKRLETRQGVEFLANNFRAKIIDVGAENLIVEFTGNHSKVNALIQRFTEEYEVLELARTGITGLGRGIENVTYIED